MDAGASFGAMAAGCQPIARRTGLSTRLSVSTGLLSLLDRCGREVPFAGFQRTGVDFIAWIPRPARTIDPKVGWGAQTGHAAAKKS
jgi:hypothetical protein